MVKNYIKQVKFQNSYLYCAFLMAFFLPLSIKVSNLFLILFFVSAAISIPLKKGSLENVRISQLLFTLAPLLLFCIVGLFYSNPLFIGSSKIGKSISFLVCPLLFLFLDVTSLKKIKKMLFKGIVLGCVLSFLILLANNFLNYYATRPFPILDDELLNYYYTYYCFTEPVSIHPTYLGTYALFAIGILMWLFKGSSKKRKVFSILSILVLSLGVLFLNSRVVFMLYAVILFSAILSMVRQWLLSKKIFHLLVLTLILGLTGIISKTVLTGTFVVTRMTKELSWELSDQKDSNYNLKVKADSRIARWKSGLKVIRQKPFLGHGTKMEKTVLEKQFVDDGLLQSAKNRYDSHNMYLSMLVEYGVVGLLLFLVFLSSNLWFSMREKNLLGILFYTMVAVACFFENYLANNAGITFVAMFGSVLYFINIKKI